MNILLLGGSGFIGKEILKALSKKKSCFIMAVENKTPIELRRDNITIICQNFANLNVDKLPALPDLIIHSARYRTGKFGKLGRKWMADKGRRANEKLMKQVNKLEKKPRIIYISGSLMYGSIPGYLIHENFPLFPTSFAKEYVAAEQVFLQEIHHGNPNVLMLRVPWVIGSGSWFEWNYMKHIQQKNKVPLYGEGSNTMTFIDVRDLAKNVIKMCQINHSGILNLFNPQYMSQRKFAESLSQLLQKKLDPIAIDHHYGLNPAVKEAFISDIQLGSKYHDLQFILQQEMLPIEESLEFYSSQYLNIPKEAVV